MKNEIRNEKTDPIVLARKRKNVQGSPRRPKHQAVRRGNANWEPPAIDGEDEQSSKAHTSWMQKEKKEEAMEHFPHRKEDGIDILFSKEDAQ